MRQYCYSLVLTITVQTGGLRLAAEKGTLSLWKYIAQSLRLCPKTGLTFAVLDI